MKKQITAICIIALVALMFASVIQNANAHSGRTDGRGGHTNHSTGEYHYHHGYSAHSHYDMDGDGDVDCPYDFKDKTNHSSNSNNYSKNNENNKYQHAATAPTYTQSKKSSNSSSVGSDIIQLVMGVLVIGVLIAPGFFSKR